MAHPLVCPTCNFTTLIADELYSRKVSGRQVKVACKGCRTPLAVDATGPDIRVSLHRVSPDRPLSASEPLPAPHQISRGPKPLPPPRPQTAPTEVGPSPAPLHHARRFEEEELPTLRRSEVPTDESFLSPIEGAEPPSMSWPQTIPPLVSTESLPALLAPASHRPRRRRVALPALVVVLLGAAAAWGARNRLTVEGWVTHLSPPTTSGESPAQQPAQEASTFQAALAGQPEEATEDEKFNGLEAEATPSTPVDGGGDVQPTPTTKVRAPSQEKPVQERRSDTAAGVTPESEGASEAAGVGEPAPEVAPGPFDKAAAAAALQVAESQAAACRTAGDPSGTARVVVTFAPSGRATSATVSGPPYAGTPTGGCIAGRFRSARVPGFDGSFVTVTKTVVLQ